MVCFEALYEILSKRGNVRVLLLKLVYGDGVWDGLDQSACWTGRDDIERFEPQRKFVVLENVEELPNEL